MPQLARQNRSKRQRSLNRTALPTLGLRRISAASRTLRRHLEASVIYVQRGLGSEPTMKYEIAKYTTKPAVRSTADRDCDHLRDGAICDHIWTHRGS